uniref:Glutaredoxin domain-containing protein n=1 Tax=Erythrolobus australicus TaxID=1077150 RepID=A0A7S1XIP3_9RHOD|mmetsp:Transcript_2813/g.7740  ORF Transcript_2813/g.7740 Transcript_2813/m.7740 type:complete len:205 (+) Transcript_2813:55-669(+)
MDSVESVGELAKYLAVERRPVALLARADGVLQCEVAEKVLAALQEQLKDSAALSFATFDAASARDVSAHFKIDSVPSVVLVDEAMGIVDRIVGADAQAISSAVRGLAETSSTRLQRRMLALIEAAPVMLFMKGDAEQPKCKFSRQMLAILRENNVAFETYDILSDRAIRERLKLFSKWPTFPQYVLSASRPVDRSIRRCNKRPG